MAQQKSLMFPLLMPDTPSLRNWVSFHIDNPEGMQGAQLSDLYSAIIKPTSAQLGQQAG